MFQNYRNATNGVDKMATYASRTWCLSRMIDSHPIDGCSDGSQNFTQALTAYLASLTSSLHREHYEGPTIGWFLYHCWNRMFQGRQDVNAEVPRPPPLAPQPAAACAHRIAGRDHSYHHTRAGPHVKIRYPILFQKFVTISLNLV